jgi:hypothetical protein
MELAEVVFTVGITIGVKVVKLSNEPYPVPALFVAKALKKYFVEPVNPVRLTV